MVAVVIGVASPGARAAGLSVNCDLGGYLQARIGAAASGSTILVKGTCFGNFSIAGTTLTLKGNPAATLDGSDSGSVLTITGASTVHLIALSITGGLAITGGGINRQAGGGLLTLFKVSVHDNLATGTTAQGGGIYSEAGSLMLTSSSVVRNHAVGQGDPTGLAYGAGIYSKGPLMIMGSTVSSNRTAARSFGVLSAAAYGGGIYMSGTGDVKVTSSHVDGNRVFAKALSGEFAEGGGLYVVSNGTLSIATSTLSGSAIGARDDSSSTGLARGGAVYAQVNSATVSGSKLVGNRATSVSAAGSAEADGGGIYASAGTTTVISTRISGTWLSAQGATGGAADGGGIFNGGGPLSVISSSITTGTVHAQSGGGNASAACGGIHQTAPAHLSLVRSSVDRNHVAAGAGPDDSNAGGGGMCASGSASVLSSTVSRNTALGTTADGLARARGGGLWLTSQSDQGAITNSTVANNVVTAKETGSGSIKSFGGGIDTFLSPLVLTDATVAANKVAGTGTPSFPLSGGGVFVDGTGTVGPAATILALNTAHGVGADCFGKVVSDGHNLIQKPSGFCNLTEKPNDKINVDPKLGLLQHNGGPTETMAIAATSPAVDAIPKAACAVAKDQRGVPRPQGPNCDIGAYERKI